MHNSHDTAIREVLNDKEEASILINEVLGLKGENKITKDMLETQDNRFITSSYYNKETDIIYKIKSKNIYILIEHQSKVEKSMAKRIAEYEIEIIRKHEREKKNTKIPLIIPIIVYTGKRRWTATKNLSELQEQVIWTTISALGRYKIYDANKYKKDEAIKAKGVLPKIILLERAENKEELEKIYKQLNNIKLTEKEREEIYKYTCNIAVKFFDEEQVKELKNKYKKGGEGDMLVETLKREMKRDREEAIKLGLAEGRAKGMAKGRIIERTEIAKKMLKDKVDKETIKRWTNFTDKELEKIEKSQQMIG